MLDKKVLFVDDSPTMRRIIMNSLKKIGFTNILDAENGLDALEKMEKQDFDLVLTDWNMPEMNGEQFVKKLRSNEKYETLPILMITTRGMKDDVITAVKLGINGYIVKPFTPEILKGKITDVMSKL
ncbi:MAG: two-component system response regulator [Candidatus Neomarinimicrobiota bacterium]|nr:MAG: two-component system response regulator [Candidatus Neomarinimicrobiota bacterium]